MTSILLREATGQTVAQKEDPLSTQGEDGHLLAKEKPQKRPALLIPWSWTGSLQKCKQINLLVKPPSPWYLVMVALSN